MIGDLKPYAEYKESGLSWLGPVPAHWQTVRNGSLFGQRSQTGYAELPILEVSLKTGVQVRNFGPAGRKQIMSDLGKYKRAVKGDLAYNTMRMWQGALGVCPVDGLVSPAYVVARPYPGVDARYFAALFRTGDYMAEIDNASRGIVKDRNRLYWDQFKQMRSPCPPPEEQVAIMRFLDWANTRLERTIRAKRRVIALLVEKKQTVIHRAITSGADRGMSLKPSGVPWLGDIPKHWTVRRLKSLSQFVTSGSRGWARYYADTGSVFLRIGNISTTSVDLRLKRISYVNPPKDAEGERTRALPDDLLLSITAQIGAVGVVPEGIGAAFVNQHTALIRLRNKECVPRWIAYVLLSQFGKDQCRLLTNGGTKVGLTLGDVRCLAVLLPPIDEQQRIVAGLESQTQKVNAGIARLEREIELLREFQSRLVAEVLAGKFDVRAAASRLPEAPMQADSAEPADEADDAELADEEAEA